MVAVRPLPVRVALVQAETLDSYLSRIAAVNHLDPHELRLHLGMRTRTRPPDLERLSTMTGHSARRLARVLADACPPSGRSRLSALQGRLACRHCTANRGISHDVWCVRPDQRLCRRHQRWLGSLTERATHQHDIGLLPDVVHAQRRHHRLLQRHGVDDAGTAIHAATTIIDGWAERGLWSEHRERRLSSLTIDSGRDSGESLLRMLSYPEVVTLANLFASESWRSIASADRKGDRLPFDREVARRLDLPPTGFDTSDPLVSWQEGEALIRRQRLHQQPGYRGPEVWLSQPTELHYELTAPPTSPRLERYAASTTQ